MSNQIKKTPILCLDFDGVLHSYSSGWCGPRKIPDPPVEGALEFLCSATDMFDVHIFSSRSRYFGGRWAMKQWIKHWMTYPALEVTVVTPDWLYNWIARTAFADPWEDEVKYAARCLVKKLKFPTEKPPALVTIDDRCICFTGKFPSLVQIATFKPWNRLGT